MVVVVVVVVVPSYFFVLFLLMPRIFLKGASLRKEEGHRKVSK